MRVFKNSWFRKFARKERIADVTLCDAVSRAERGIVDADLGGGLIKQRIARPDSGRSGGYRSVIIFRRGTRAVFAFGYAKSAMDNLGAADERDLKEAAKLLLAFSDAEIDRLVTLDELVEVECHAESQSLPQ